MPQQIKTNPFGQIADGVMEQLKQSGSQAVKAVASEPAKILEQILGGSSDPGVQSGEQSLEQGAAPVNQGQASSPQDLLKKKQETQEKAAALYKLHQQRLQEEIAFYQQHKQQEEQEKQAKEQQEEQKKQVIQLQREREKEEVWQQQIKAVQGSHEGQQGKM